MFKRIAKHIPREQLVRYLLVGAWNTLFGYGCFFLCAHLFLHLLASTPSIAAAVASVVSMTINITVSFFGYKLAVFRTKGNFLREYLRSFLVYIPSLILNGVAIGPLTTLLEQIQPSREHKSAYIAGAILAFITVVMSFFGHKHISFRDRSAES